MDSDSDEHEYGPEHIPFFHQVVDMFGGKPDFQRLVRLGLLSNLGYDVGYGDTGAKDYDLDRWVHRGDRSCVHGYRVSSSSPQPLPRYHGAENATTASLRTSREEEKAEKKRLKRQKRKERKRNEQQEKEKEEQSADKSKEEKEKKAEKEKAKPDVKEQAAAKEASGSEQSGEELSDDDLTGWEELDLMSSFVSKARSKLEQKPKAEREKKMPAKEAKSSPEKPKRVAEAEKAPAPPSSLTAEENLQISTQLANTGNSHANAGDFKKAVLFYTDAIKHNPRDYRLFGNRSFCFERMRLYMKALDDAELSLGMYPGWVKGLFRKGKALAGLKRYEEAERAFRQVLEVDSSRSDAAQELMRVQIAQIMGYGYTSEQSAHALNARRSVKAALLFLGNQNHQPASGSSVSSLKPRSASEPGVQDKRSPPATQNSQQQKELYPVWVGNLFSSVTESSLEQLFNKVGPVYKVRLLTYKRCAFVNFTKAADCEKAIRRLNGFEFNGVKIVVRYPDRIPTGMGISRSALTS